jgi:hypothetical protein
MVTFRADVYFGKQIKSDHLIVLTADDSQAAEDYARWFFQHHGGWSRAANLTGQDLLSEPRVRDLRVADAREIVCYEQRVLVDGQVPKPR